MDGEFAHAVAEILEGIDDGDFFAELLPQSVDILRLEIDGAGEEGLVEGQMFVGERKHDLGGIAAQGGPAIRAIDAGEAENGAIETDGRLHFGDVEHGCWTFELHGDLNVGEGVL